MDCAKAVKGVETKKGIMCVVRQEDADPWILYVDGASNKNGFRAGIMLISLEGHKIHCALHFRFLASNNEVEYKAFIAGLHLARDLRVCNVDL